MLSGAKNVTFAAEKVTFLYAKNFLGIKCNFELKK